MKNKFINSSTRNILQKHLKNKHINIFIKMRKKCAKIYFKKIFQYKNVIKFDPKNVQNYLRRKDIKMLGKKCI